MTETQKLIRRIKAAAKKEGRAETTMSAMLLGGGHALRNLEAGGDITLRKWERVSKELTGLGV